MVEKQMQFGKNMRDTNLILKIIEKTENMENEVKKAE